MQKLLLFLLFRQNTTVVLVLLQRYILSDDLTEDNVSKVEKLVDLWPHIDHITTLAGSDASENLKLNIFTKQGRSVNNLLSVLL